VDIFATIAACTGMTACQMLLSGILPT